MLFLIEYDRRNKSLITFKAFDDEQRRVAKDERLELELSLNQRGIQHEVVILEAPTEAHIRHTHRRYFETIEQLARLPLSQQVRQHLAVNVSQPEITALRAVSQFGVVNP